MNELSFDSIGTFWLTSTTDTGPGATVIATFANVGESVRHRTPDYAALQLGFYLASWGMYRGSGFLLWKDYRIHRYAVRELLKPKYDLLLRIDFDSSRETETAIRPLLALVSALREAYVCHAASVNGRREEVNVTDTLVTKIVLAAFGCTPANDWYFVEGLRSKGIAFSEFNKAPLRQTLRVTSRSRPRVQASTAPDSREWT